MVENRLAMTLRRRITQRLDALGISMRQASLKAGLGTHFLRDLLANEGQSPRAENLARLAYALETTPEWLLDARGDERPIGVPIMGKVGAAQEFFPATDQGALDYAPMPPEGEAYGAAEIDGDSGWPVYKHGGLVYYGEWRTDLDELIGEDVLAELADGRMLLKTLAARNGSTFTLTAHNGPPLLAVEIVRAAPIEWVRPPRAKRR